MKNNVFKEIAKGLLVTVVGFLILEALLRIAYFGRNWMVTEIPLTYVFGDDHGPMPPWLDGLRILEPDKVLIWKNRPNIQRRYIDVFIPAHDEREKTAILRRLLPLPPESLKGNPTWEISVNSERFRDVEIRREKASSVFRINGTHGDQRAGDHVWSYSATFAAGPGSPISIQTVAKRGNGKAWMSHISGVSRSKLRPAKKSLTDLSNPSGKFTCTLIHGIPTPLGMSLLLGLYLPLSRKMSK
jgi:hypothetical protein